MCTARYWGLPLLPGAKVLHGVGTNLGVLYLGLLRRCVQVWCQAVQVCKLLWLCCGVVIPGNVLVSNTACTVCEWLLGALQQLQWL